ncbi:hypothetical protein KIF53_08015 [Chromobacterium subtsugae]|uniref:Uncharacterized protein n=1 Tax=Chromobacterium subtsugae TaxID=251747 RepID=A0ABS7FBW1_9NEIS|nr:MULTISPECIES: hypothetical protein [Chromobacterium]KUM03067.1 hypothetical protein Cv017_21975 [Chromobacterium subtsugae]KZE84194.1 hypothetical protein AWB61_21620 [Chromobacterium sp. F49]MBW7568536.1 hypothetical protein [Chromobacterium subtsugae]MBW8287571.1 hypothetical protein [Chromobacterium subtsugae]OBU84658.1 hypothetical protein MY55_20490 [Chromobacterium subtsugae]
MKITFEYTPFSIAALKGDPPPIKQLPDGYPAPAKGDVFLLGDPPLRLLVAERRYRFHGGEWGLHIMLGLDG